MSEREMLELAAKAINLNVEFKARHKVGFYSEVILDSHLPRYPPDFTKVWNPLSDDGDAFRLAVKLNLNIQFELEPDGAVVRCIGKYDAFPDADSHSNSRRIFLGKDACAATRVAITRAAAEIGRNMP